MPKNFGGPYLSSPTWYRGRSVLKIIVWSSSLHTNIFLALGKHNKGTRASEVSQIWKFSNCQNFPFLTQKPIFWGSKSWKWMENLNVTNHPLKICSWGAKLMKKLSIYRIFSFFSIFLLFFQFFQFLTPSEVEIQCKQHSEIDMWIFWEDFEVENQIFGEYKKDAHASVRLVKFWVFDFGALGWMFLVIFCHFSAQN